MAQHMNINTMTASSMKAMVADTTCIVATGVLLVVYMVAPGTMPLV
jgi:hypothetical protein